MNVCIVGYGSIARLHLAALAGTDTALRWVVGRLPEPTAAFAREFGAPHWTTDLDEALADTAVDAVIVCSPTDLHAEQTERALRAGKHALCEIPLATSLAETDALGQIAQAFDRRLMVCHSQRFWPNRALARELIASGRLRPYQVVYRHLMFRRDTVNWMGRTRSWVDNLLWHHGCHAVDMVLWLLGADRCEVASGASHMRQEHGNPMDVGIVLRLPDDRLATLALSYDAHLESKDCTVIGEEDTLVGDDRILRSSQGLLYEPLAGVDPKDLGRRRQAKEFLASVREGREPAINVASIRPAMAVLQAVQDQFEATKSP
ncbi:MAG: Gfo/Idh/MocA family oxidoreductase [Chloroflexi bacterium]|nr:Gfo/Idh/MocA family oxidoreductase [Chloroflexota bacterium]